MNIPFKDVEDWADYNGCLEMLGYGDHARTDIEVYIREISMGDPSDIIAKMKQGRLEYRPKTLLYDWKTLL